MAINVTRWSPDTCGCVIEYAWDTDTTEDARVHTHHASPKVCPAHAGLATSGPHARHGNLFGPTHALAVVRENMAKNALHGWVLDHIPRARKQVGDGVELADGVEYRWSFTGQGDARKLTVEFAGAGLSAAEKGLLRAHAATLGLPVTVL